MSDVSQGAGWWQASDGKWYAPELHPGYSSSSGTEESSESGVTTVAESADFSWSKSGQVFPTAVGTDEIFGVSSQSQEIHTPLTPLPGTNGVDPISPAISDSATDQIFGSFPSPTDNHAVRPNTYPGTQYPQVSGRASKSKLAAGLLAIFLGWLGIHRFYMGFTKLGVVMLLLSLLSLGALLPFVFLWGVVDGILVFANVIKRDAYGDVLK